MIDHINVRVADLDTSIRFYENVLGARLEGIYDMHPTSPTRSAYMLINNVRVELAEGHNLLDYNAAGMINHFGVGVNDIFREYNRLRDMQVKILSKPICVNDVFWCFFFAGPSGERFEAIQYLKPII